MKTTGVTRGDLEALERRARWRAVAATIGLLLFCALFGFTLVTLLPGCSSDDHGLPANAPPIPAAFKPRFGCSQIEPCRWDEYGRAVREQPWLGPEPADVKTATTITIPQAEDGKGADDE